MLDIEQHIMVMNELIESLPPLQSSIIGEQFSTVLKCLVQLSDNFSRNSTAKIEELSLELTTLKFDLEITRKERDELRSRFGS